MLDENSSILILKKNVKASGLVVSGRKLWSLNCNEQLKRFNFKYTCHKLYCKIEIFLFKSFTSKSDQRGICLFGFNTFSTLKDDEKEKRYC